jgi:hypothetical protein
MMMSLLNLFSRRRRNRNLNAREEEIKNLLLPANAVTPWGTLINDGRTISYTSNTPADERQSYQLAGEKALRLLGQIPTDTTLADRLNNDYYTTAAQLLTEPILGDQGDDDKALNRQLAARNLLGGSYEALSRNLLQRRYARRLDQARLQARQTASGAYSQNLRDQLATLEALRQDQDRLFGRQTTGARLSLSMADSANSHNQARAGVLQGLMRDYEGRSRRDTGGLLGELMNYWQTNTNMASRLVSLK